MAEFRIERAGDSNMRGLTSVQKALINALADELIYGDQQLWATFQPDLSNDPLEVYFAPLGEAKVVGAFKLHRDGEITDRHGVGENYLA